MTSFSDSMEDVVDGAADSLACGLACASSPSTEDAASCSGSGVKICVKVGMLGLLLPLDAP